MFQTKNKLYNIFNYELSTLLLQLLQLFNFLEYNKMRTILLNLLEI